MKTRVLLLAMILLTLDGCAKNGKSEWENLDYARIARENYRRENDATYVPPPSVSGCVDDDLYNCNRYR